MASRFEFTTLSSAELKVYELIQKGENYRNIAKTEFVINGVVKRFNPSQISQIKGKFEAKSGTNNLDPDKAKVFKLFKKGLTSTDVLIQTGLSFEFVDKAHEEFLEFENKVIVPHWVEEHLFELATEIRECNNWNDVYRCMKETVESHNKLQKHYYFCCKCSNPMPIREKSLQDAIDYLSGKWGHKDCF